MSTTLPSTVPLSLKIFSGAKGISLAHSEGCTGIGFSGDQKHFTPQKDHKTSLSHVQLFLQLCGNGKGTLHKACAVMLGQVQPWHRQSWLCQAQWRGCREKSPHMLRVLRELNLFRTSISFCTALETAPSTGYFCRSSPSWGGQESHVTHRSPPDSQPVPPCTPPPTLLQRGEQGLPFCQKAACLGQRLSDVSQPRCLAVEHSARELEHFINTFKISWLL